MDVAASEFKVGEDACRPGDLLSSGREDDPSLKMTAAQLLIFMLICAGSSRS